MFELAMNLTALVGSWALFAAGVVLPSLFLVLVLKEQWEGLRRAESQSLIPTAWKRALVGSWTLRGRLRLPRRIHMH